jgi:hypothetical protein
MTLQEPQLQHVGWRYDTVGKAARDIPQSPAFGVSIFGGRCLLNSKHAAVHISGMLWLPLASNRDLIIPK